MRFTRARYQRGSLIREKRKVGPDVWIFRWREQTSQGRVKRKVVVGTVEQYRSKAAAQNATETLRIDANRETWTPSTVEQLVAHYTERELPSKAHSTQGVYGSYIRTWVLPCWGNRSLSEVKTVAVEEWLKGLPLANGSKAKVRNVMHALFNHAMRHEWAEKNPITLVRQSAKRLRTPDVLDVDETKALLSELKDPFWTMVFLAAATGLRVSEILGMKWQDVIFDTLEIHLSRAIVDGVVGGMKTEASRKPVPLDSALAEVLLDWRARTPYNRDDDWLFASPEKLGRQPYWPDSALRKAVRPGAVRAGIVKHIGWHTFRHSFATLLKANGEDVKVVQESLRHANSRITLDVYTQGLMPTKRQAQGRVVKSLLAPNGPTPGRLLPQVLENKCRRVAQLVRALP
jgi:integrase